MSDRAAVIAAVEKCAEMVRTQAPYLPSLAQAMDAYAAALRQESGESRPAEWVWYEKGEGFAVGPKDKGCIAVVFSVDDAISLCREHNEAVAAHPKAEADEIISKIIADLRDRRGLRQAWEAIDVDVRNEIVAGWRTFYSSPPSPSQDAAQQGAQEEAAQHLATQRNLIALKCGEETAWIVDQAIKALRAAATSSKEEG